MKKKEIDIDDEIEKSYEKFYEWLETCPVEWSESSHPSSGLVAVNFIVIQE
jgi:hypothetical protein